MTMPRRTELIATAFSCSRAWSSRMNKPSKVHVGPRTRARRSHFRKSWFHPPHARSVGPSILHIAQFPFHSGGDSELLSSNIGVPSSSMRWKYIFSPGACGDSMCLLPKWLNISPRVASATWPWSVHEKVHSCAEAAKPSRHVPLPSALKWTFIPRPTHFPVNPDPSSGTVGLVPYRVPSPPLSRTSPLLIMNPLWVASSVQVIPFSALEHRNPLHSTDVPYGRTLKSSKAAFQGHPPVHTPRTASCDRVIAAPPGVLLSVWEHGGGTGSFPTYSLAMQAT